MRIHSGVLRCCFLLLGLGLVWACPFDVSLREYLSGAFWLPFAKHPAAFERPHVRRADAPFAGMTAGEEDSALGRLRRAYQPISSPSVETGAYAGNAEQLRQAVAAARSDSSLTPKDKEEVALIEAKIDLRAAGPDDDVLLQSAKQKLMGFLRTAKTPAFRSEARGWLARIYYLLGDQTDAGKIYLDELNRSGSNLSRETLLNSLSMLYGYDGGTELQEHLEEYFDTPEHAAFAIDLVTNPRWPGKDHPVNEYGERLFEREQLPRSYERVKALLEKHAVLLKSETGGPSLALLGMRVALRMGDPPAARKIGEGVPESAEVRGEPDFNWMLASAEFLAHDYVSAEKPLLALFQSPRASLDQKAAAAYGLCGVYRKTRNVQEQLRFALWLRTTVLGGTVVVGPPAGLSDFSVYWAGSGWDLDLLLDAEAPIEALSSFVEGGAGIPNLKLVQYALAVRLARVNRYREAADLYQAVQANVRFARMRRLAELYEAANVASADGEATQRAKFQLADFISANPDRIYFNDRIWEGYQRYSFQASTDSRLTRAEREELLGAERRLKDDQEERWRAYLILREIVRDSGDSAMRRRAAALAVRCLRGISDRFGRAEEIRRADIDLSQVSP